MSDTAASQPALKPLFGLVNGRPQPIPVIGFNGPLGSGKTLAALTLCPEETIEIGIEDSGVTYDSLPVKHRFSMYKEVTSSGSGSVPKAIDCFKWFLGIVDKIEKGELTGRVLVIDPITDIQTGLFDWIEEHAADFGKTPGQYAKMKALMIGDAKAYIKMLLGRLSRKLDCVIYTAHMGSVWNGGAPVAGKQKVKGVDTFHELSSLVVHLTRNIDPATGKQSGPPVGSIAPPHGKSRLSVFIQDKDGNYVPTPILPPRIEPFTWQKVREYVAKPPNYDKLKKDELGVVEVLSEDDKLLIKAESTQREYETAMLRKEMLDKAEEARARNASAVVTQSTAMAKAMGVSDPPPVKPDVAESPVQESVAKTVVVESTDLTLPELQPWARDKCDSIIRQQMTELGMSPDQMKAAVRKRGAERLSELTNEKLEELRRALWSVLTKREAEAKK